MNYRKLVHELSRIQEIRKSTIISLASAPFLEPDDQHGVLPAIVGDADVIERSRKLSYRRRPHRCCRCGSIVAISATVISKPAAANPESGSRSGDVTP
jgi:hypothetical protein